MRLPPLLLAGAGDKASRKREWSSRTVSGAPATVLDGRWPRKSSCHRSLARVLEALPRAGVAPRQEVVRADRGDRARATSPTPCCCRQCGSAPPQVMPPAPPPPAPPAAVSSRTAAPAPSQPPPQPPQRQPLVALSHPIAPTTPTRSSLPSSTPPPTHHHCSSTILPLLPTPIRCTSLPAHPLPLSPVRHLSRDLDGDGGSILLPSARERCRFLGDRGFDVTSCPSRSLGKLGMTGWGGAVSLSGPIGQRSLHRELGFDRPPSQSVRRLGSGGVSVSVASKSSSLE